MTLALQPAGAKGAPLARVARRLTTPVAYLSVLGGLQVLVLWQLRLLYGSALPLAVLVLLVSLILLILAWPKQGRLQLAGAVLLAVSVAVIPTVAAMVHRARTGVSTNEHDGLLQTESAIDRLLHGHPIYGVDWSNTPMAGLPWDLPGGNPALHHLAYYPLTILVGVPARLAADALGLPFDYRAVLLAFVLLGIAGVLWLPVEPDRRLMIIVAVYINPAVTTFLWSGRNDAEFIGVLFVVLALLARNQRTPAALALGVAVALKPFAWPAVPFLLAVLWLRWRQNRATAELAGAVAALAAAPFLTMAPFLLANPAGLWSDLVLYTAGGIKDAYPIGGYGFGNLVSQTGLVRDRYAYFPFGIVQAVMTAPVLLLTMRAFLRRASVARFMGGYVAVLFMLMFFARFFNDNYLGLVIALGLTVRPLGDQLLIGGSLPAAARAAA